MCQGSAGDPGPFAVCLSLSLSRFPVISSAVPSIKGKKNTYIFFFFNISQVKYCTSIYNFSHVLSFVKYRNKASAWCSLNAVYVCVGTSCPGAEQLPSDTWTASKGTLHSSSPAVLEGTLMPSVITVCLTSTTLACTA